MMWIMHWHWFNKMKWYYVWKKLKHGNKTGKRVTAIIADCNMIDQKKEEKTSLFEREKIGTLRSTDTSIAYFEKTNESPFIGKENRLC